MDHDSFWFYWWLFDDHRICRQDSPDAPAGIVILFYGVMKIGEHALTYIREVRWSWMYRYLQKHPDRDNFITQHFRKSLKRKDPEWTCRKHTLKENLAGILYVIGFLVSFRLALAFSIVLILIDLFACW